MASFGIPALAFTVGLALCIILYDLLHKQYKGSVLLMGMCRALVYASAAAAVAWPLEMNLVIPPVLAILLYIAMVTIIARFETSQSIGILKFLTIILPLPVLAVAGLIYPWPGTPGFIIFCGVGVTYWLEKSFGIIFSEQPRIGMAVLTWIAGICLIDAYFLALLDETNLMIVAFGFFLITIVGHQFIKGT